MKVYFLSSTPCALFIGGAYFGISDTFERFASINLKDRLHVCFSPQNALPISFFLDENILLHPPQGCDVYRMENAVAIYARDFPPSDASLRVIAQKRDGECLVSVFSQGAIQVCIQTNQESFISYLPPSFCESEIAFHGGLCFINSPSMLAVFNKKGERVFCEKIRCFSITDDTLNAVLPLSDALSREAEGRWKIQENALTQQSLTIRQNTTNPATTNTLNQLLAYVFFESIVLQAEYKQWLCDELQEKADSLRAYLGDFLSVIPTDNACVCGLVYQKAPRLFEVRYFQADIENEKIVNISPSVKP